MADEKKQPPAPREAEKTEDRQKVKPETGQSSYGHEGPTDTANPAQQQPS